MRFILHPFNKEHKIQTKQKTIPRPSAAPASVHVFNAFKIQLFPLDTRQKH